MAAIQFDAKHERQVVQEYDLWCDSQPRRPVQFGGGTWLRIKGGPYPDNTVYMQFPDAFVDELERSGFSFARR